MQNTIDHFQIESVQSSKTGFVWEIKTVEGPTFELHKSHGIRPEVGAILTVEKKGKHIIGMVHNGRRIF